MQIVQTNYKQSIRAKTLVQLFEISKPIYKFFFKRNKAAWNITTDQLATYENHTLGKDLYLFLQREDFQIEPKLESHDVSHVLLQYPTEVPYEIAMQFFFLGNQKKSLYTLFTVILGFLILPEYYKMYQQAYLRGKTVINISKWQYEHLLKEKTATLRSQIFNTPSENILYI